jgi:hypothetical protein
MINGFKQRMFACMNRDYDPLEVKNEDVGSIEPIEYKKIVSEVLEGILGLKVLSIDDAEIAEVLSASIEEICDLEEKNGMIMAKLKATEPEKS